MTRKEILARPLSERIACAIAAIEAAEHIGTNDLLMLRYPDSWGSSETTVVGPRCGLGHIYIHCIAPEAVGKTLSEVERDADGEHPYDLLGLWLGNGGDFNLAPWWRMNDSCLDTGERKRKWLDALRAERERALEVENAANLTPLVENPS